MIGKRIKKLRLEKNLSINKLAKNLCVSPGNISDIEKDHYQPSAKTIIQIAEYFSCTIDWLLTGKEPIFTNKNKHFKVSECCDKKYSIEKDKRIEQLEKELAQMKNDFFSLEQQNKELNTELMDKLKELLSLKDKLLEEKV